MGGDERMVLMVAVLLVMVGLAFKLSAVPFHFWCPDVFEGATAEVGGLPERGVQGGGLGSAAAGGAGLERPDAAGLPAGQVETARSRARPPPCWPCEDSVAANRGVRYRRPRRYRRPLAGRRPQPRAQPLRRTACIPIQALLARLIALLAVVTCTFGNLAAYGQTNIKRLLAYSTIAHAGYMLMAVPAVWRWPESIRPRPSRRSAGWPSIRRVSVPEPGRFAVVAFLRNAMRSEEFADYAGLIRHCSGRRDLFLGDPVRFGRGAAAVRVHRQVRGVRLVVPKDIR